MSWVIDTSSFIGGWNETYSPDAFGPIWQHIEDLIAQRRVRCPDEVLVELKRQDDSLHYWAKRQPDLFVVPDEDVQEMLKDILRRFPKMVKLTTAKTLADPWVIALAKVLGWTVVSEESPGGTGHPKIPYVCSQLGVRHIKMFEFVRESGWKTPPR